MKDTEDQKPLEIDWVMHGGKPMNTKEYLKMIKEEYSNIAVVGSELSDSEKEYLDARHK